MTAEHAQTIAIIGTGFSRLSRRSEEDPATLVGDACDAALLAAGIDHSLVDGLGVALPVVC